MKMEGLTEGTDVDTVERLEQFQSQNGGIIASILDVQEEMVTLEGTDRD